MHYKQLKRVLSTLALGLICLVASAQHTVSGVVKDSQGAPLPGVSVIVEGTTQGTVTDFDGNYTIANVPESANLQASFIGFTTQVIAVGNQTTIDFTLKDETQELGEVVAVGYGTMKKTDITGSIASVSTEKLVSKGATSVMENLQGSVPGVNITQSSGRTNGGFNIEIRGKSSINSDTKPIYVIDGVVCSDMDFLNPQDIERLDVLKDASSTAIYGSRATAGVIMITTKGGSGVSKNKNDECKQKFNITYDGYYGVTTTAREMDLMTPEEFYKFRFLEFLSPANSGVGNPTYYMTPASYYQMALYVVNDLEAGYSVMKKRLAEGKTVDWVDVVTQNGQKQNHYISASGSTNDISYHMGVGITQDEGIYAGDKMTKYSFKGSLDSDMNQYVSAGFNFNGAVTTNEYANDEAIQYAYRMNPFMYPYDDEGNLLEKPGNKTALGTTENQFTDQVNPLLYEDLRTLEKTTYRLLGNAYATIKPIKGLSIKTTYSPSYTHYIQGEFHEKNALTSDYTENNMAQKTESTSFGWTWTNIVNYNNTFASDHSVDLMLMNEWNHGTTKKDVVQSWGVLDGSLWYNMGSGVYNSKNSSSNYSENSMLSYAFRANYSYKGKYMFTGTVRWDGSSKFADGNRWGSFPSMALAWRLSEEDFMENTKSILSNLKLRLSYGVTGNNAGAGNYATQQTAAGPTYATFGSSQEKAYYPSSIVNGNLSWEKSHEINFGVDFGFLDNRINGTLDVYQKTSKDLLYDVPLPLESGGGDMTTNIGEVQNRGVEISVSGAVIDNEILRWDLTATFAKNINKVKEINGTGKSLSSIFIDEPINSFRGYEWDGIVTDKTISVPDHEIAKLKGFTPGQQVKSYDYYYTCYGWYEGDVIVKDKNGDGKFSDADYKIYHSDPSWTGSLTSTITSFGFDLSASLYTKQNYWVQSNTYGEYLNYSDRGRTKIQTDWYIPAGTLIDCDGIRADGSYVNPTFQQKTHYGKYPAPWLGKGAGSTASYWIGALNKYTDASYVKIKNITLGYSLPKNILETIHMQKVRVYCTVTNPFCWTDYKGWDPEWANASLKNDGPSTITWEFGLNLKL